MPRKRAEPKYLRNASGQARTVIVGRTIYLGVYGTPEGHEWFDDHNREWHLRENVEQYTHSPVSEFFLTIRIARTPVAP